MIATLVTFFVVGVVGLILLGVLLSLVGALTKVAFGLVGLLLFKVLPIVFLGWLIVRFLTPRRRPAEPPPPELDL